MSANYVVDLGNTTQQGMSLVDTPLLSGSILCAASGAVIGTGIDMLHSDSYCNVVIGGVSASGQVRIQVQTSDTDVSGNYTDPTSGLAQLPGVFASGGLIWINSGGTGGGAFGPFVSGNAIASGFQVATAFQRLGRYVRANMLNETSVQYAGALQVVFLSQLKTTGSGGGFTLAPTSGTVNV
jgi:hypothetical protein